MSEDTAKQDERCTLRDLEFTLPNGFHDALVLGVSIDYVNRTASIDMMLDYSSSDYSGRNSTYRRGRIELSDVESFALDRPERPWEPDGLMVCGDSSDQVRADPLAMVPVDQRSLYYRFFVQPWNGFMHIVAGGARIVWLEPEPSA
jgi:hypothetical protein